VQLGQRVEAATLIYRIAKLSPLWLEIQAPVDFAATLTEGMSSSWPIAMSAAN
jgi:cobalt-zinc-cadmium efflux system membrane fusion protein